MHWVERGYLKKEIVLLAVVAGKICESEEYLLNILSNKLIEIENGLHFFVM